MREIRLELTPQQRARAKAAQMGACFQCGRRCKGVPDGDCAGSVLRDVARSTLRALTLYWPVVTLAALSALTYMSLN